MAATRAFHSHPLSHLALFLSPTSSLSLWLELARQVPARLVPIFFSPGSSIISLYQAQWKKTVDRKSHPQISKEYNHTGPRRPLHYTKDTGSSLREFRILAPINIAWFG
ncbi:hypothetical protein VN97_g4419 [Penicillium thymicola]|uniref:Uncharacterized protein n=1 Tax=Penicillium thymicola TaxID=293382 RepID=A0AAI9TL96_PENTH|nr:hypothetical protein VN97_g4419 [Penicillium thymicola]